MIRFALMMLVAVVPAVLLCVYVYREDKYDKESIYLLLKLFAAGAVGSFVTFFVSTAMISVLNKIVKPYTELQYDRVIFTNLFMIC